MLSKVLVWLKWVYSSRNAKKAIVAWVPLVTIAVIAYTANYICDACLHYMEVLEQWYKK